MASSIERSGYSSPIFFKEDPEVAEYDSDQWNSDEETPPPAAAAANCMRHPAENLNLTLKIILRIQSKDDPELLENLIKAERNFDELLAFAKSRGDSCFQLMLPKSQIKRFTEQIALGYEKLGNLEEGQRIKEKYSKF